MLQIFHSPRARSQRIVWLCEEMNVVYEVRVEKFGEPSPEFLAASPLGVFPALRDGDVSMIESVAMMMYIMGKYGPTELEVRSDNADYARYLQYLHFGEASMAMYGNGLIATKFRAPEAERKNWTATYLNDALKKRVDFLEGQLASMPFVVGDRFTAADISVGYALGMAKFAANFELPEHCTSYLSRLSERPAYQRAGAVS